MPMANLVATYKDDGALHFQFSDWLGTASSHLPAVTTPIPARQRLILSRTARVNSP